MISATEVDEICRMASATWLGEPLLESLRKTFPEHHFTWCMEDDVSESAKPFREMPGFNLYLVNSSDHCSVLSNDAENASGVVIAEVMDDDD